MSETIIPNQEEILEVAQDLCPLYEEYKSCTACDALIDIGDEPCLYKCMAQLMLSKNYRKHSEWISVGERLPDAELQKAKAIEPDVLFPCLVVRASNVVSYIDKAWYWGKKFTTQDCTDITDSVTHWMSLPEAPTFNKKEIDL